MGVTVHPVDEGVDSGPVVLQEAFEVSYPSDIAAVERVHGIEHRFLPRRFGCSPRAGSTSTRTTHGWYGSGWPRRLKAAAPSRAGGRGPGAPRAPDGPDKRGLVDFGRGLHELGVELVSTGGTARELGMEGVETRAVERLHRLPEILDGRVKTLNPRIYAGLLAVRSNSARRHAQRARDRADRPRLREPLSVRAGVLRPRRQPGGGDREHRHRRPHADPRGRQEPRLHSGGHPPESYDAVLEELRASDGRLSARTRVAGDGGRSPTRLATTRRSRAGSPSGRRTSRRCTRRRSRRCSTSPYGENPHQRAAYYAQAGARTHLLSMVSKLHGKELSFNNLLDLDSGRRLVEEFEAPAAAIVKHNNPAAARWGRMPRRRSTPPWPPTA